MVISVKNKMYVCGIIVLMLASVSGCGMKGRTEEDNRANVTVEAVEQTEIGSTQMDLSTEAVDTDGQTITTSAWIGEDYPYDQELQIIDDNYRNYYEIFVYSFYDSDGDGIGDLNGVTPVSYTHLTLPTILLV